jgi:hypothetical protein
MSDVAERPNVTLARWIATVHYRTAGGLVDVQHDLEEIEELQELVERGPHWDTIERIEIVRADGCERRLTVEEAAAL